MQVSILFCMILLTGLAPMLSDSVWFKISSLAFLDKVHLIFLFFNFNFTLLNSKVIIDFICSLFKSLNVKMSSSLFISSGLKTFLASSKTLEF